MSEPVKSEETQPVVVEPSAPKSDEVAPVAETASEPAAAVTTTATGDEVTPVVEKSSGEGVEEKKEEKVEPQEITKGTLSKLHGGLLSFFKRERFFYFSEDAVSEEKLKTYLHRDNASVAIAAYATQTGKGLLFYSKQEGHVPHGIIKLADVTEILPIGLTKFDLKLPSGDLHFESPTNRDSWVSTLGHKVTEAKLAEDEVIKSEGYQTVFQRLTKPTAVVAGRAPAEAKEKEKEKEPEEPKKVEGSTPDNGAGPSDAIKRSASKGKKRVSVLKELLSRGEKKGEPVEKKEEPAEKKEVVPEEPKAEEPTAASTTTTTNAPPVTDAPEETKEVKTSEETGTSTEPAVASTKKRHSIFGSLISRRDREPEEKKEKEKEKEPETVVKTEPETRPIDTPVVPASTEKVERTSSSSPPRPKFSFFREKKAEKVEKEPEVKPEEVKPTETATEPVPVPAAATDIATDTTTSAEGPIASDSPSPATSPKERRLSSFFAFKKEKKDDVKSDSEEAEPSSPKPSTSPANFVVGLYRRASKAGRGSPKDTEAKEVAAPATVPEEAPTVNPAETPNGTDGTEHAAAATPAESSTAAIGDVVAEAVNVGQAPPVQAAA